MPSRCHLHAISIPLFLLFGGARSEAGATEIGALGGLILGLVVAPVVVADPVVLDDVLATTQIPIAAAGGNRPRVYFVTKNLFPMSSGASV